MECHRQLRTFNGIQYILRHLDFTAAYKVHVDTCNSRIFHHLCHLILYRVAYIRPVYCRCCRGTAVVIIIVIVIIVVHHICRYRKYSRRGSGHSGSNTFRYCGSHCQETVHIDGTVRISANASVDCTVHIHVLEPFCCSCYSFTVGRVFASPIIVHCIFVGTGLLSSFRFELFCNRLPCCIAAILKGQDSFCYKCSILCVICIECHVKGLIVITGRRICLNIRTAVGINTLCLIAE